MPHFWITPRKCSVGDDDETEETTVTPSPAPLKHMELREAAEAAKALLPKPKQDALEKAMAGVIAPHEGCPISDPFFLPIAESEERKRDRPLSELLRRS
jgi:hypothetical protein